MRKVILTYEKQFNFFVIFYLASEDFGTLVSLMHRQIVTLRLYGDYESLVNGYAADAMVDFTGGVPESLELSAMELSSPEVADNFFCEMMDACENRALILCHITVS